MAACLALCGRLDAAQWQIDRGWLTCIENGALLLGAESGPALELSIDDAPFPPQGVEPTEVRSLPNGAFEVHYLTDAGEMVDRWDPLPALGEAFLRTATYTNRSDKAQDLLAARMRLAPALAADGARWHPRYFWIGEAAPGRAVCVAFKGSADYYHLERAPRDGGALLTHQVQSCWRLAPGETATTGAQGVWLGAAGRELFRAEAQRWYTAIGLRAVEGPDWLAGAILYELNAGGHIDSRFSDVGGFARLQRAVPYLADLGISAVWLQGVHTHKTPPNPLEGGWNLYDPLDYSEIDTILGGADALKALTEAFRGADIHVIGELVPHGGHSVQATALEDGWTYQRDGSPQRNWGGCGMDYSCLEWQGVMRGAAFSLGRDFAMEGVRVDVADGSGPNWKSPATNHASYSTLAGSVEMLRAMREGLVEAGVPHPALIPENWNLPEHFAIAPVGYGHELWMLFANEIRWMAADPEAMASRLREYFEEDRGQYPEGARVLRYLNNHDTVCEVGRARHLYGDGLARALYGVCLMVEGIPMMYQDDEIGGLAAFRRMNWARRHIPEFASGEPDYTSIEFAPAVFACLRKGNGTCAVGLSNLSGKTAKGTIALPADLSLPASCRACDGVSGQEREVAQGRFAWTLAPYETALIRIGAKPESATPKARFAGEMPDGEKRSVTDFDVVAIGNGVQVRTGRVVAQLEAFPSPWTYVARPEGKAQYRSSNGQLTIAKSGKTARIELELDETAAAFSPEWRVFNADAWMVSGQTALLEDRVLRRKFPFPPEADYAWTRDMPWGAQGYRGVAPTGRLWESVFEPLNPGRPAAAFIDGDGAAIVIEAIESDASSIVLTDRTDEAVHRTPGREEPYGLAMRFHENDPDLLPDLAAFGRWQPWQTEVPVARASGKRVLRFTVRAASRDEARALLDAPRGPVTTDAFEVRREGDAFNEDARTIWYIEPGAVTWTGLTEVEGAYRIRFELRHSEISDSGDDLKDAYEIRIDGEDTPLEWIAHNTYNTGNAYFGHAVTPPLDLTQRGRSISIKTLKPWCAVKKGFHLLPEP